MVGQMDGLMAEHWAGKKAVPMVALSAHRTVFLTVAQLVCWMADPRADLLGVQSAVLTVEHWAAMMADQSVVLTVVLSVH
jgi:hypothetical protein